MGRMFGSSNSPLKGNIEPPDPPPLRKKIGRKTRRNPPKMVREPSPGTPRAIPDTSKIGNFFDPKTPPGVCPHNAKVLPRWSRSDSNNIKKSSILGHRGDPYLVSQHKTCLVLRHKTCLVLRHKTCFVLRHKTCLVSQDKTCLEPPDKPLV